MKQGGSASLAIVSPHLNESEEEQIRSRFAQIRTRDDYVTLMLDLDRTAQENDLMQVPFPVW